MKFLLNVGAQKCGTTWLYTYLQSHPEFYDQGKELNIIQRGAISMPIKKHEFAADLDVYFDHIKNLKKTTGDFTHYEGSTGNVFKIIKDGLTSRDIEIVPVYIMRDPIRRAWSSWHMLNRVLLGKYVEQDLYNFNMPKPAVVILENFLQCKYKETIEALDSTFDTPLYFFYEDFFKQDNMDLICDSLNISRHSGDFTTVVNRGNYETEPPEEFIEIFCRAHKNHKAVQFIQQRFPDCPWDFTRYNWS